ncbi:hypothetical protein FACS1894174_05410 [Bacteroidia bacterium]|nr:hypothetical protein FACS1894174_05410 [Bacteroidia bacterium]
MIVFYFVTASAQTGTWVRVNQLGYLPNSVKTAVFISEKETDNPDFEVKNGKTNASVFKGKGVIANAGRWGMKKALRLNFSSVIADGEYYVECNGAKSPSFRIGNNVYDGSADFILQYMRQQRCGYNPYLDTLCHQHDGFIVDHPVRTGEKIDVRGGWHDASDYLQYLPTSANATFQMLFAWQQTPDKNIFKDEYDADGKKGKNGIPDVLDEVRWGLEWMLRMNPDSAVMFNQIADDRDHASMRLPSRDPVDYGWGKGTGRPVYFITGKPQGLGEHKNRTTGVASSAGKFASAFALGAEVFRDLDPAFAATLHEKAIPAFRFGEAIPGNTQTACMVSPYFYEEDNYTDDMELAAAVQYVLTGNEQWRKRADYWGQLEEVTPWMELGRARHYQFYPFVNLGHYYLSQSSDRMTGNKYAGFMQKGLDCLLQRAKTNDDPFLNGVPFIWCSNNLVTAAVTQARLYHRATGDGKYLEMEAALRDWLFGCNPWGTSMICGYPENGDSPVRTHSFVSELMHDIPYGGLTDGPVYRSIYENLRGIHLKYDDLYAPFQSGIAVYHDDPGDYSTNEPTMDGTASLSFYLSAMEKAGKTGQIEVPVQDTTEKFLSAIGTYLTDCIRRQTSIRKITIDSVSFEKKRLQLFANEYLSYGRFDQTLTDSIYSKIKFLLPDNLNNIKNLKNVKIELYSDGYKIEDYIPLNRKERYANPTDFPLKRETSLPYAISKGLQDKHIALWHSHGWYYNGEKNRWEWQRARLFQTVEDLFPQSFVLPYIIPMLEKAGANVLVPRERDMQCHEVIVDNDRSSLQSSYTEVSGAESWVAGGNPGFAHLKAAYADLENPFLDGTYRQVKTITKGKESVCTWLPDIPGKGRYGVYISYASLKNSAKDAHYTVYHTGGKTEFTVNQTMGGGTWIFLGFFDFDKGCNDRCKIVLSNQSRDKGRIVTADAVKIGGGMGNIARGEPLEPSGRSRYAEGSRYWLQWAGMPDSIYRYTKGERDYTDDYQSRGLWVNHLVRSHVPVDAVLAFHTDAGTTFNDSIVGTLGICMTHHNGEKFANGKPRILSRDLVSTMMDEIVKDIRTQYEPEWTRRHIWNRSYSEARLPEAPTMLLELLSHQNFADMRYGLDPDFRFTVSRAIYKGFLKFIAYQYKQEYVVAPLPVKSFGARFAGDTRVHLEWQAVNDPAEPTAMPAKYRIYTAIGENDFDNGKILTDTQTDITIEKDKIYRFRIAAVNEGGEGFPSEILSVCRKTGEKGVVLVINGFTRISAPDSFSSRDSIAGFLDFMDHGVPDGVQTNYIGSQYEFRRKIPWADNDATGFGASNADYETAVVAGNTFDYPFVHGKSIVAAGYSFVSTSSEAVMNGKITMNDYKLVDLIRPGWFQTGIRVCRSYSLRSKPFRRSKGFRHTGKRYGYFRRKVQWHQVILRHKNPD